ncbi:MAG: preprotein translocase subunit SecA [Gammaproteobacteria bacterium]
MISALMKKIVGTKNDRVLKRMRMMVAEINAKEPEISQLSDDALRAKTATFKQQIQEGVTLDDVLVEAFAVVREAGKRVMNMRHFDCQLIGGMTLHEGHIAEMRTGEGKTLVATLPAYLNALSGEGVHVVTVNDYLAQRDSQWMSPLYNFLGLEVGVVVSGQNAEEKRKAYAADITYGTNNEFGFDYLRDNMVLAYKEKAQRRLNFAIVDEVDSILIDEARTPLIISGPSEDSSQLYKRMNVLIPKLTAATEAEEGHYTVDEKNRHIELTEAGHEHVEALLIEYGMLAEGDSLYSPANLMLLHHMHAALKAHVMFSKDVDYIVQGGQIVIVDEHTGRTLPGRRWSDGIHQAVEAKEGVPIQNENQTLASTTFQNYFRLYKKLSGMTGTADTEAYEFREIYGLDVVVIPTNKPMIRKDHNDVVFLSQAEKYEAIVAEIKEIVDQKAPVLVGTVSIESSELLSRALKAKGVDHKVLNAKYHEKEAEIIAQAGKPGAVTIATNMAGRGTDIVLGGNWQAELAALTEPSEEQIEAVKKAWAENHATVLEAGGLYVVGTERHESRRIDNQLRGRSGRQGDPGSTRFYLSLEDNLMRIFASDRVRGIMQGLGMEKGEAIEHKWVTKSIENAQKKVEGRNFDIRKSLLDFDNVANDQRRVIYEQRDEILMDDDIADVITSVRSDVVSQLVSQFVPPDSVFEMWNLVGLEEALKTDFQMELPIQGWVQADKKLDDRSLCEKVLKAFEEHYQSKEERIDDPSAMRQLEKQVMLQTLDRLWKDHLSQMDYLRQGIHLRGYAQKNPKQEYKREAFELFRSMLDNLKFEVVQFLTVVELRRQEEIDEMEQKNRAAAEALREKQRAQHPGISEGEEVVEPGNEKRAQPVQRQQPKVGRNEPCPCGSGRKYKHCHGQVS